MRTGIYSIFDRATAAYMRPSFMASDEAAIRSFKEIATSADHEVGKHPEDYSLCRIGRWDDQKGRVDGEEVEVIATGLAMVAASQMVDADQMELLKQSAGGTA